MGKTFGDPDDVYRICSAFASRHNFRVKKKLDHTKLKFDSLFSIFCSCEGQPDAKRDSDPKKQRNTPSVCCGCTWRVVARQPKNDPDAEWTVSECCLEHKGHTPSAAEVAVLSKRIGTPLSVEIMSSLLALVQVNGKTSQIRNFLKLHQLDAIVPLDATSIRNLRMRILYAHKRSKLRDLTAECLSTEVPTDVFHCIWGDVLRIANQDRGVNPLIEMVIKFTRRFRSLFIQWSHSVPHCS